MVFSNDQNKGLEILNSGVNCFVHGDAGTGKSTLIEHFSFSKAKEGKKVGKCAFTGLATMNLLKRHENETVATINTLFEFKTPFIKKRTKTINHISNYDIIIIDEVSTCTALYFTFVSDYIEAANEIRHFNNLPPIQLIVCGDFYQLSPFYDYEKWTKTFAGQWEKTIDYESKEAIIKIVGKDKFGEPNLYAFSCEAWEKWEFKYILLTQNHRQEHDVEYQNNLKIMRESVDTNKLKDVCDYFNSHCYNKKIKDNTINLYWKNDVVEDKNKAELQKLPGITYHYRAKKTGELMSLPKEKFSSLPIIENLYLKQGAQVIFTTNDIKSNPRKYANGDIGIITDCDEEKVVIKLLRNGEIIRLYYDQCANYIYKAPEYINKPDGSVEIVQEKYDGEIYQFPLKLAYALTIYKSQGQTFDNVNVCYTGTGEHILYVALSRARTIDNLFLSNHIYPYQIKHSKLVESFYKNLENNAQEKTEKLEDEEIRWV